LQELPLTPNGKLDRRALPAPDKTRADLSTAFQEPRTATEQTLAMIWSRLLGRDRVGIYDNFFDSGGDSFTSLRVIAMAGASGIRITPRQMLQHQTIAQLAEHASLIANASDGKIITGPLPMLPTQAYYLLSAPDEDPHIFNIVRLVETHRPLERHLLADATRVITGYHDALRFRFFQTTNGWQASLAEVEGAVPFSHIDLSQVAPDEQSNAVKGAMARLHSTFNFADGPLLRIVYFTLGEQQPGRLLFLGHHFTADAFSLPIVVDDFLTAYESLSRGELVQLPPKTTSVKDYAERVARYAQTEAMQEIDYWVTQERRHAPLLPLDYPDGREAILTEDALTTLLTDEKLKAALATPKLRMELNNIALAALYNTYKRWTGQETMLVSYSHHGRTVDFAEINLSRTVGYITSMVPLLIHVDAAAHGEEVVSAIGKHLQQVPNYGLGYNALRYLGTPEVRQLFDALPWPELHFNYIGRPPASQPKFPWIKPASAAEYGKGWRSKRRREPLGIFFTVTVPDEGLRLHWNWHRKMFKRETIERLADIYVSEILSLIESYR
jgi:non-ribosomal peptide synthase protein (TIGR01720 family)